MHQCSWASSGVAALAADVGVAWAPSGVAALASAWALVASPSFAEAETGGPHAYQIWFWL